MAWTPQEKEFFKDFLKDVSTPELTNLFNKYSEKRVRSDHAMIVDREKAKLVKEEISDRENPGRKRKGLAKGPSLDDIRKKYLP